MAQWHIGTWASAATPLYLMAAATLRIGQSNADSAAAPHAATPHAAAPHAAAPHAAAPHGIGPSKADSACPSALAARPGRAGAYVPGGRGRPAGLGPGPGRQGRFRRGRMALGPGPAVSVAARRAEGFEAPASRQARPAGASINARLA
jgi:hypothetical protein